MSRKTLKPPARPNLRRDDAPQPASCKRAVHPSGSSLCDHQFDLTTPRFAIETTSSPSSAGHTPIFSSPTPGEHILGEVAQIRERDPLILLQRKDAVLARLPSLLAEVFRPIHGPNSTRKETGDAYQKIVGAILVQNDVKVGEASQCVATS
jgi:hypothetical protein